jgi:flavin reductase (DIM6/NTAB) family NADH-FMN oxidoreductase RutF
MGVSPLSLPSPAAAAIDPDQYRAVLARFVTGITVVTTIDQHDGRSQPFGTTVNSFGSVSLEPPLVSIAVGRERSIHPVIARTGRFMVNILGEDGQALSDCFSGAPSDIPREAFCGASWRPGETGQPLLDEAIGWVGCEVERIIEAGDHTLYIGRVVELGASDANEWPLLYFRRRYLRIERAEASDLLGKPDQT